MGPHERGAAPDIRQVWGSTLSQEHLDQLDLATAGGQQEHRRAALVEDGVDAAARLQVRVHGAEPAPVARLKEGKAQVCRSCRQLLLLQLLRLLRLPRLLLTALMLF